jgi:hypothetical protein
VGAQFFNLFNHPNFDQPVSDISTPDFGTIISAVNTPSSILGSFLGGDASHISRSDERTDAVSVLLKAFARNVH